MQPNGSRIRTWLGRVVLVVAGVIVLVGAFGGGAIALAVTGGPDGCQAGGGPIVVNHANAEAFDRKWDAFNAALAGGSDASVTFDESEVTSRVNAWNDEKDIFEEIRICIHDGYGEATGTLHGVSVVDAAFRLKGTVQLTGDHPAVHVDDIELGNVPGLLFAPLKGQAENPIDEVLDGVDLHHNTYTMTYAEGEVRIDGHARDKVENASATIVRDGATVTISPVSGSVGTAVNVQISGMPAGDMAPFGLVTFKDSTGAFGEDELTTDYVIDPRTLATGGSKAVTYRIPANVLVLESPGAQNPTKKAPTSTGQGFVVFTNATVTVEVPFTVVQR